MKRKDRITGLAGNNARLTIYGNVSGRPGVNCLARSGTATEPGLLYALRTFRI
jgi:hypothetical protein